jgi:hypothetical protein
MRPGGRAGHKKVSFIFISAVGWWVGTRYLFYFLYIFFLYAKKYLHYNIKEKGSMHQELGLSFHLSAGLHGLFHPHSLSLSFPSQEMERSGFNSLEFQAPACWGETSASSCPRLSRMAV